LASVSTRHLAVVAGLFALAAIVPTLTSAADAQQLAPSADALVSAGRPERNFGSSSLLRAQSGAFETYLRFKLTPWVGQAADGLDLVLGDTAADPAALEVTEVGTDWRETSIDWLNRPAQVGELTVPGTSGGEGVVVFHVGALFESGTIERNSISLRVTSTTAESAWFWSREGDVPPLLVLGDPSATPLNAVSAADAYVTPVKPDSTFGAATYLAVDGDPQAEAWFAFDVSAMYGRRIGNVKLKLQLRDDTGPGLVAFRVDTAWDEMTLTWNTAPVGGELLATLGSSPRSGPVEIDVSAAFPRGIVDRNWLSLRLATTSGDGFLASSREGTTPPVLVLTPRAPSVAPTPTAPPTAPPTASPSPTRAPSPTPSPTRTPSPTTSPTASPTAPSTPTPSPSQSATPAPVRLYFRGNGGDHGVGLSQYGARGRAAAGQTYDEILAHYYSGTTLGTIEPNRTVRVLLASAHVPTGSLPARVTARSGGWFSPAFVDDAGEPTHFPPDSYVQLVRVDGVWLASAFDHDGNLLASIATTDLTVKPTDGATRLEMKWRSSLVKYTLYRGAMRMTASGESVRGINVVAMDDYIRGVVPAEVPPLWPIEAVKAQAVAARGYAYVRLHPERDWDVVPTSDNQVYGGVVMEHPRSNLAVEQTANQVVMAGDRVAHTFFFAVGGGHTENNEYAWVGNAGKVVANPISYLRGVPDYDADGLAYDRNAPGFAWSSDTFTWARLDAALSHDSRTNVGTLTDLHFDRGVSGRVYRVTITGSSGRKTVSGAVFRAVFNGNVDGPGLRSTMYYLEDAP
jgi:SpoIID/LytB domain protein